MKKFSVLIIGLTILATSVSWAGNPMSVNCGIAEQSTDGIALND